MFSLQLMRTSPPVVTLGSWASILWLNWSLDFFAPLPFGLSSSMLPGIVPWKMYFSFSGTCLNTSGSRWKFFAITDRGVCALFSRESVIRLSS